MGRYNKHSKESFIAKVLSRFPENANKFDYSESVYNGVSGHWDYSCKICGHEIVNQVANNHLNGRGCRKCFATSRVVGVDTFREQFEKMYEGKGFVVDYSKYTSASDSISVVCPQHGVWETTPTKLVYSNMSKYKGCPSCNRAKLSPQNITLAERHKEDYLKQESGIYLLKLESEHLCCYKLGIAKDIQKRLSQIKGVAGSAIEVLFYEKLDKYHAIIEEQTLLQNRDELEYCSPTRFDGSSELLTLTDEQASDLIEYLDSMVRRIKQT